MKTNQFNATSRGDETIARIDEKTPGAVADARRPDRAAAAGMPRIALAGKISAARVPVAPPGRRPVAAVETVAGALIAAALYFVLSQPAPTTAPSAATASPATLIASGK